MRALRARRPSSLRGLLAVAVAGLLLGLPARASRAEEVAEGPVRVRSDPGLERLAAQAERSLPGIRDQVAARLGWRYAGPRPEILIVPSLRRMREAVGAAVPPWAVGVASPSRALIVIRSDLLAAGYGSGLTQVLRHEWVHLSWGSFAKEARRALPLWVEEGLAEEIGGGVSVDAGAALDLAVAFDRLLHFRDLERRFPADAKDADLAYKQSRSWVRHLLAQEGWGAVREVLATIVREDAGPAAFPDAIRRRTGLSLGEWHASWRRALESEARPWFHLLLRDFPGLIFMSLALVGAVAFFFVARRRRRQIRNLPDGPAVPLDPFTSGTGPEVE